MGGIVLTNQGRAGNPLVRLQGENPDVFPGSPLAVIGLWVFAVRQRLSADAASPLPWIWDPRYRPEEGEDGAPLPDGSPRKVLVESGYNTERATRNYRPAVYISRGGGPVTPQKASVDNLAGTYLPTGLKAYHCMASMPVVLECESDNAGESSAIGELLWAFVLSTRDIFRKDFGFHEITEPVLGDTQLSKKDKEVWVTPVQFTVMYDQRWGTEPIAVTLQSISLNLRVRLSGNPDYFVELATESSADRPL